MISQLNFNIEIGIFEIFILRLHEKKISTATSKKNPIWPIRWEKTNLEKKELGMFFTERQASLNPLKPCL